MAPDGLPRRGFAAVVAVLLLAMAGVLSWRAGLAPSLGQNAAVPHPRTGRPPATPSSSPLAGPSASGSAPVPTASAPIPADASVASREATAIRRLAALGLPVFCGGAARPYVALTFDDGPGPLTPRALAILASHGAHATFFLVGKELAAWPALGDVPRLQVRDGNAVGDHTWDHIDLAHLSAAGLQAEIGRTRLAIERLAGVPVGLFRPPYGAYDPAVLAYVRAAGMVEVMWDVDSRDSQGATPAQVLADTLAGLHPGAIIDLHENRAETVAMLPRLLDAMRARGLKAVTVPYLLAFDPPTMRQLRTGTCPG